MWQGNIMHGDIENFLFGDPTHNTNPWCLLFNELISLSISYLTKADLNVFMWWDYLLVTRNDAMISKEENMIFWSDLLFAVCCPLLFCREKNNIWTESFTVSSNTKRFFKTCIFFRHLCSIRSIILCVGIERLVE